MERNPKLDELVIKYGQQYGNCAQTTFRTLQDGLNLQCDVPAFLKALTAFPGIGGTGETCGAVSGAIVALGLTLGPDDTSDKAQAGICHAAAHKFCLAITDQFGSTDCGDIIEHCCGTRYDLSNPEEARQYAAAGGLAKCINVVQTSVNIAAGIIHDAAGTTGKA